MKLRLSICVAIIGLSAHGAVASTSVVALDPIDTDLTSGARSIGAAPAIAIDRTAPKTTLAVPATAPTPSANPLWAVPLSALSNTRNRPIFSASRRPPPSAVAPVAAPLAIAAPRPKDPERPQLALVGTIASGVERFGIFLNQSTAAALRLKVGEDFQGWRLSSVQGREATLEKDTQIVVLTLPQPGATPAEVISRLNPALPPAPGQLLSAPQPRLRLKPNRQM